MPKTTHSFKEIDLHAYLDGELSESERAVFELALSQDEQLKAEVCELRKIKQQMQNHYRHLEIPELNKPAKKANLNPGWAMAATLLLGVWIGFFQWQSASSPTDVMAQNSANYILHIDSQAPEKVQAMLAEAHHLLKASAHSQQPMNLEIVANFEGIEVFNQQGQTRQAITDLLVQYQNIKLIACQRALEKRREEGHPVQLMSMVKEDRPALDEIVDRLQQGWHYIKI